MTTRCLHRTVGLTARGKEDNLSCFYDPDQSNVLPSSQEVGTGMGSDNRTISFDLNPPTLIPSDQPRLTNSTGGFDLFMVQCSVSE